MGDPVELSEAGRAVFRHGHYRLGQFRGWTRALFAKVLWDGQRTPQTLHPDFIKLRRDGEEGNGK